MDPGAPDIQPAPGLDPREFPIGLDFELSDEDVMYGNLRSGMTYEQTIHSMLASQGKRPTEATVFPLLKRFRTWLNTERPPGYEDLVRRADRQMGIGKARSDERTIGVANVALMLQNQGVPEDVIKKVLGYTGVPKREIPVAMAAVERKGRGRMRPMFS